MKPSQLVALLPILAVVACGGNVYNTYADGDGGGLGDGGGGDGGNPGADGGVATGCPPSLPNDGVACAPEGAYCEYGASNGSCGNPTTTCTNGAWKQPLPTPGVACLPSDSCPASHSSIVVGQGCGNEELECNYPGQGRCTCATEGFGGPPMANPDGGPIPNVWECEQLQKNCPVDRPRIGSACTPQNGVADCFYGDCSMPDSVDIECVDGVWTNEPYACAG